MGFWTTTNIRHKKIEAILARDTRTLSYEELEDSATVLREEANRLMAGVTARRAANDSATDLQEALEQRYDSGFAQWLMDQIGRSDARSATQQARKQA